MINVKFLKKNNPDLLVHCTAHVGGIAYNKKHPIEIFEDNSKNVFKKVR